MEKEIWKDIIGYEGLYQVSNLGNIRSLNFKKKGFIKNLNLNICNLYYRVALHKNNIKKFYRVNRLVAIAFIPNPENKPEINHIDGNKLNNNVSNLEWSTRSENELHKYRTLGYKNNFQINHPNKGLIGDKNKYSKKINQYDLEGNFIQSFNGISEAGRKLNINRSNISACCNGRIKKIGGFIFKYNKKLLIDYM